MKVIQYISIAIAIMAFVGCNNQQKTTEPKSQSQLIEQSVGVNVYYFHYTRRCKTCTAIEDITSNTLKEMYGSKVKFQSLNLDDLKIEEFANSIKINGQALVVISDTVQVDLTNVAFMNALDNPEKLISEIKTTLAPLL